MKTNSKLIIAIQNARIKIVIIHFYSLQFEQYLPKKTNLVFNFYGPEIILITISPKTLDNFLIINNLNRVKYYLSRHRRLIYIYIYSSIRQELNITDI